RLLPPPTPWLFSDHPPAGHPHEKPAVGHGSDRRPAGKEDLAGDLDLGLHAGGLSGSQDLRVHGLGDTHRLLDEGLDNLGLGHGLDDLALDEDLTLTVAGSDTQVGVTGLTGAIDDATHDRHAQRNLESVETLGNLL